jgi:hypothetical protein
MPLVAGIVAIAFFADMREQPRPMPSKITVQEAPHRELPYPHRPAGGPLT